MSDTNAIGAVVMGESAPVATDTAATPVATPAPAVPAAPTFLDAARRARVIPLEWPLAYAGVTYTAITVRRMNAAEVADFMERLAALGPDGKLPFPLYVDEAGAPIPQAVMDALDVDDRDTLNQAAVDFLPRRFRTDPPASDTAPSAGNTTEPSSSETLEAPAQS